MLHPYSPSNVFLSFVAGGAPPVGRFQQIRQDVAQKPCTWQRNPQVTLGKQAVKTKIFQAV